MPTIHRPGHPATVEVFKFTMEKSGGESEGYKMLEQVRVPWAQDQLRAMALDSNMELWRRGFALNWLAETPGSDAADVLLSMTRIEVPEKLRLVAIANLGFLRQKSSAPTLLELMSTAQNSLERIWIIDALGEIGDVTARDNVRTHIRNTDPDVQVAAIRAAGRLKDPLAAPLISGLLANGTKGISEDVNSG